MRTLITAAVMASISVPAFAQTQPTRPSAYSTIPTLPSAFPTSPLSPCYPSFGRWHHRLGYFNRSSPCYSGTIYPSYSAAGPFEFARTPTLRAVRQGASRLNEAQARSRIQAKGYSNVSGLHRDRHGVWRGDATLKDGRPVEVTLDLQGNVYSKLAPRVDIWIRPFGQ